MIANTTLELPVVNEDGEVKICAEGEHMPARSRPLGDVLLPENAQEMLVRVPVRENGRALVTDDLTQFVKCHPHLLARARGLKPEVIEISAEGFVITKRERPLMRFAEYDPRAVFIGVPMALRNIHGVTLDSYTGDLMARVMSDHVSGPIERLLETWQLFRPERYSDGTYEPVMDMKDLSAADQGLASLVVVLGHRAAFR